jgi:hypothetical protein
MAKINTLSRVVQLRTGHGALGSYFKRMGVSERNHNCKCSQPETVDHVLKDCALCESGHGYLRETSPKLDLSALLDSKKSIEVIVKFLESLTHLLN